MRDVPLTWSASLQFSFDPYNRPINATALNYAGLIGVINRVAFTRRRRRRGAPIPAPPFILMPLFPCRLSGDVNARYSDGRLPVNGVKYRSPNLRSSCYRAIPLARKRQALVKTAEISRANSLPHWDEVGLHSTFSFTNSLL